MTVVVAVLGLFHCFYIMVLKNVLIMFVVAAVVELVLIVIVMFVKFVVLMNWRCC